MNLGSLGFWLRDLLERLWTANQGRNIDLREGW
jgi:hypothetical protein